MQRIPDYQGPSTQEKPRDAADNSIWLETGTFDTYIYNAETKRWTRCHIEKNGREKSSKISMFICPCCGGNDTEEKEGKTYCAYCGTLVRGKKTYTSSPLENIKPKLLPPKTIIW